MLMNGFMEAREMLPSTKMTALYHLRDVVRRSTVLPETERQALMDAITAVGPRTPASVIDALRDRIRPMYHG